jgi:hypothetical protein
MRRKMKKNNSLRLTNTIIREYAEQNKIKFSESRKLLFKSDAGVKLFRTVKKLSSDTYKGNAYRYGKKVRQLLFLYDTKPAAPKKPADEFSEFVKNSVFELAAAIFSRTRYAEFSANAPEQIREFIDYSNKFFNDFLFSEKPLFSFHFESGGRKIQGGYDNERITFSDDNFIQVFRELLENYQLFPSEFSLFIGRNANGEIYSGYSRSDVS